MRISDWSSDVCSSDLVSAMRGAGAEDDQIVDREVEQKGDSDAARLAQAERQVGRLPDERRRGHVDDKAHAREDEEQHGLARAPSAPADLARTEDKIRASRDTEATRRARPHTQTRP